MWKKVIPNVLYNVGIFVCLITGYQFGIVQKQYGYLFGALVLIGIFVFLKIRILKEIRNPQKKP
jgi:hypothetical protein